MDNEDQLGLQNEAEGIADEVYETNFIHLQPYPSENSDLPALSYSYSGVSNSSSNQQLYLQSSRISQGPSEQVHFFHAGEMYKSILSLVKEVHESLSLQEDFVLYILYTFKWSKDRLYEQYYEKAECFQEKNALLKKFKPQYSMGSCPVCCEERKLLKNPLCVHSYCRECWREYIVKRIREGSIFFNCMDGCEECPVLNSFISSEFPHLLEEYSRMTCINYSKFNIDISYCPGAAQPCDYFCQKTEGTNLNIVECLCSNFFCFRCQKEPHYPATCHDAAKWHHTLNNTEGNNKWISQNTVKCPSCIALVNKYIGCSYMKCICGAQFCYNCSQKWDQVHKLNRGECVKIIKKSSLNDGSAGESLLEVQDRILGISRTMGRHLQIISGALRLVTDEWILSKFYGIRKDIAESWYALKWGLIARFLYKRKVVDQFIEDSFLNSITDLMRILERAYDQGRSINLKDLVQLGDEVVLSRETLKKNQTVWVDAWTNS